MGDFSVKAVLSAVDKNFSSTMKGAMGYANNLKSTLTSGIGFGIMMGAGQKAFQTISGGITGLIGEMSSAGAAWKTFQGNMEMNGKTADEINSIKSELSDFATQTIYSASDMASTFAQLDAVGTKNTTQLVKGFGGLAAAAENPTQAMKTLSQQATQMAAKPAVAWEDFKLILEQTPAGVAAVAKTMGMSTTDMIKNIQDGTVATEDFLDAVAKTGTNADFTKLATEYKTVGQAADGLTETMTTKLQPAFDLVSSYGISAISKITDSFDAIDGEALVGKITSLVDKVAPYWNVFKENVIQVKDAFGDAFSAIGGSLSELNGAFGSTQSISSFSDIIGTAANALKKFAGFLEEHSDTIAKVLTKLPALMLGFKGLKIARAVAPGVGALTGAIGGLAKAGIGAITSKLFGLSKGQKAIGAAGVGSSNAVTSLKTGLNSLQKSAGIALIIGALAGLALAMKPLAELGTTAITPLVTFGVVVGGLGIVLANMGTKLQASMGGIVAFAASISIMALAMTPLANTGKEGAIAMGVFGLVVAGLVVVFATFGTALTAAIPAMLALGASVLMMGAGMALASILIDSLTPFIKQLGDSVSQVALSIAVALTIIMSGFSNLVSSIADAVSQIVSVIGSTLVNVMQTAGDTISQVIDSISDGFVKITDGVTTVIDAISGGFTSVLEAVADVISAIGESALNAGNGFKSVAEGISMIADLSIVSIAKSLGAVALGLGEIAGKGEALQSAASGLAGISSSIMAATASVAVLNSLLSQMDSLSANVTSSISAINSAFAGITIPEINIGPMIASFVAITVASKEMSVNVQASGQRAGSRFTSSLSSGLSKAIPIANTISNSVVTALGTAESGAYSCGYFIGIGLANGMNSTLGYVRSVATQLAAAAEEAVIAKSKIGSPSRVFKKLGAFIGEGFAIGIDSMSKTVESVSENMVSIPSVPAFAGVGSYSFGSQDLRSDYEYRPVVYVNAEVTSVMDGREVGYGSAKYVEEKNEFDTTRKNRLGGKTNV